MLYRSLLWTLGEGEQRVRTDYSIRMNGDTYSSRGESDVVEYGARQVANTSVADSGRPRDYYVSFRSG